MLSDSGHISSLIMFSEDMRFSLIYQYMDAYNGAHAVVPSWKEEVAHQSRYTATFEALLHYLQDGLCSQ